MPSSTVRAADAPTIAIKSGEKIAFLGDSITQQGSSSPAGYVRLVIRGWETNGVAATPIPAGISGHKSNDMLKRLDRDVLSQQPDWMTLSCGVNDVWHGEKGVPLAEYKINITAIVDKAQAAGIKVMILTATMIGEDQNLPNNQKLIAYNDFLRSLAQEKNCLLADLNADMQTAVAAGKKTAPHGELTAPVDGVHMNALGNQVMAASILRAFGLSPAQVEKTRESWSDIPATMQLAGKVGLSMRQYNQLRLVAAQQNRSVADLLNAELHKSVDSLLTEAADKD